MRVLVQRSKYSKVTVDNEVIGEINNGMVLLVGFKEDDTSEQIDYLVKKIVNLRIFDDENHIMNRSILDTNGSILSISQFTLYADTKKGNRPSYVRAMNGEKAISLYNEFNDKLTNLGINVAKGRFGADMLVSIENDGPVTILLEKE